MFGGRVKRYPGANKRAVTPFATSRDPLWKRLYKVRQAARRLRNQTKPDLVASHFALYSAPLGNEIKKLPLVVHFHGPWAAESDVEGSTVRRSQLKFALERGVYRRARRLIACLSPSRASLFPGMVSMRT